MARIVGQITLRSRLVATARSGYIRASGASYFFWRAPKNLRGVLQHCVRAWDRAGNASGLRCARLDLR